MQTQAILDIEFMLCTYANVISKTTSQSIQNRQS